MYLFGIGYHGNKLATYVLKSQKEVEKAIKLIMEPNNFKLVVAIESIQVAKTTVKTHVNNFS